MATIYQRTRMSKRYDRDEETKEPRTIGLTQALGRVDVDSQVRKNVKGLAEVRNQAAHLGVLGSDARLAVLDFGTASVRNFLKLSAKWFGEAPEIPYLLPVGFLGNATATGGVVSVGQRELLKVLKRLSQSSGGDDSEFAVMIHVDIELNRGFSGGGNIGFTNDPTAPTVRMADNEALARFPTTYQELVQRLRHRYQRFKQNQKFHELMRTVTSDPQCTYRRLLDPTNETGTKKSFYNTDAVFDRLDRHYSLG